jgi:hypothetical protein
LKATRFDQPTILGLDLFLSSRAASEPTIRSGDVERPRMRRSSTGDLSKHVHWGERSRVILVPTREDYWSRGVGHDLWWERNDYESFKQSAKAEVLQVMASKNITVADAMSDLYQQPADSKEAIKSADNPVAGPCECGSSSKSPISWSPEIKTINFLGIQSGTVQTKGKYREEKPLAPLAILADGC